MVKTLKVDTQAAIKDVKAPLKIPLDWRWIALWIVVGLIVIGLIYYLYRRYQKKKAEYKPVKKVVILPSYQIALNALHELEEKKLWQKGEIKEYHSSITDIIRNYFEERFSMPALELPTSEAVELLKLREGTDKILDTTYNFLSNADLVKFAKFVPLAAVNEEMMKQAYEIVNKTINGSAGVKKEEAGNVQ
jgi:flagellar basal body-associated protein FliL